MGPGDTTKTGTKLYVPLRAGLGRRSPYVKDSKYIVFQDQDGAYDDKIHPNWAATDMPAHTETDDANSVPRQLEIAQSNASTVLTWEDAKAYCPNTSTRTAAGGVCLRSAGGLDVSPQRSVDSD